MHELFFPVTTTEDGTADLLYIDEKQRYQVQEDYI